MLWPEKDITKKPLFNLMYFYVKTDKGERVLKMGQKMIYERKGVASISSCIISLNFYINLLLGMSWTLKKQFSQMS